jgi:hypothetical protein
MQTDSKYATWFGIWCSKSCEVERFGAVIDPIVGVAVDHNGGWHKRA